MIRLAIVEPEQKHRHCISRLAFDPHSVCHAVFGLRAWSEEGLDFKPDVVLIEDRAGALDALGVIDDMRRLGSQLPAAMVVGAEHSNDLVVQALDAGADDCLVLPVDVVELQARVRALARRQASSRVKLIKVGPITLDPAGKSAFVNDRALPLTSRELALFEVFAERPGRLVNKDQLVSHLARHGDLAITPNAIEVYVHRLRRKLDVHAVRISTVRSAGYMLESCA